MLKTFSDEEINNFQLVDDETEPFALEDNVLRVTSPLDYETKKNYMVAVKAIDKRGGESIAKLSIKISDVNTTFYLKLKIIMIIEVN